MTADRSAFPSLPRPSPRSEAATSPGAWLTIGDRPVDVHYRDLDVVEHEIAEANEGRFHWEPLMFHLAGIPSYLLLAELSVNRVLRGRLPRPEYPHALRADLTLRYARDAYAAHGRLTELAGALATAGMYTAHAVLASRGEWITNEKRLLHRAGLRALDTIITDLDPSPDSLSRAVTWRVCPAGSVGPPRCG
ncbi:hypothetical protein NN3_18820 [Nocardia neocaledoniensis NBRC 108232]|uniref:Uncharacterized protein n=1 Tax=Nocardia neocaledoniensis TaxID=236511 RepID=A0A317N9V8_9NOCA|nr:hypothetical protein [Nocardia neocaledoniensis]PWV71703.1 hypothetical protein DFR69_110187 [Nocardia neocaledoniensis]GEM30875.1 hypothetical protein NN3_18820 [Nocardia neocaledoniensis NBRC 108232]